MYFHNAQLKQLKTKVLYFDAVKGSDAFGELIGREALHQRCKANVCDNVTICDNNYNF